MFERMPKKSSSCDGSHHDQSTLSRSNIQDIMMHDVNIEVKTKLETSV